MKISKIGNKYEVSDISVREIYPCCETKAPAFMPGMKRS